MKFYLNSSLSLDDLLQDLKRNAGQVSFILTELESRGAQTSGEELLREYASISRLMKNRRQPAEDERLVVKEIRERLAVEYEHDIAPHNRMLADIRTLLSLLPAQPAASTPTADDIGEPSEPLSEAGTKAFNQWMQGAASTEAQDERG